jgi:C4-dicarboxylate-specific signal transduction histidine kinase
MRSYAAKTSLTRENCRVSAIQDTTEREQMKVKLENYAQNLEHLVKKQTKQLKNAERLAAIGQTAGMVGHDICNPPASYY